MRNNAFLRKLSIILELSKVRIPIAVSISAWAGWTLHSGQFNFSLFSMLAGVFLLASGSSALNHIQEHKLDMQMGRTERRPIPSGRISVRSALFISLFFILTGITILWFFNGWMPAILGFSSLFWYNVIYTPLKKITPFALILGSVVGAIPPAIGWTASGAPLLSYEIMLLSSFFFIWQVPHFCILLLKYGREYVKAGFLPLNKFVSERGLGIITFVWILALSLAGLMMLHFKIIQQEWIQWTLLFLFLLHPLAYFRFLKPEPKELRVPFIIINIFMVIVTILIITDGYSGSPSL